MFLLLEIIKGSKQKIYDSQSTAPSMMNEMTMEMSGLLKYAKQTFVSLIALYTIMCYERGRNRDR